mgnify:CR=1 FL=1
MEKENLILEYKNLKDKLGHSPSFKEFSDNTGIRIRKLNNVFGSSSYSKLVMECGDEPRKFFIEKSSFEQILVQYGELSRSLKKLPTQGDWAFAKISPTVSAIEQTHKIRWGKLPQKFLEFASEKEEWKDIITLIPNRFEDKPDSKINEEIKIENIEPELLKFIPPVVQNLIELSVNESMSLDFEKKVNLIFQMLGFEVSEYGQGTGRKPDGIAKENQNRYAILIDAKSRKESYKMGTEDRKFIEYIKTFSDYLIKSGFSKKYFLIVSSKFASLP